MALIFLQNLPQASCFVLSSDCNCLLFCFFSSKPAASFSCMNVCESVTSSLGINDARCSPSHLTHVAPSSSCNARQEQNIFFCSSVLASEALHVYFIFLYFKKTKTNKKNTNRGSILFNECQSRSGNKTFSCNVFPLWLSKQCQHP